MVEHDFPGRHSIARISMRNYLSTVHLWAAIHFAERAKALEFDPAARKGYNIEHAAYVVGSVTEAAAFLESAVNELFLDCRDGHQSYITGLSAADKNALAARWNDWHAPEQRPRWIETLEKYQTALRSCGLRVFDKGLSPYQDAKLVMSLRNGLVHFTPEDLSSDDRHELGDALRAKFDSNKLFPEPSGNPYFPSRCLGYGCAAWAVSSSRRFADEFFAKLRVSPNYQISGFIRDSA